MTAAPINVLVFEDNPADVLFLREALEQDALNTFTLTLVERLSDGLPLLTAHSYEVVLLDLGLPDSRGLATFEGVQNVAPDLPIVIFSGNADEQAAVLAVRAGAQDYVVKGPAGYAMTGRTIRHAIERQNLRQSLRASEQSFSTAFHASPAAQAITALGSQRLVDVNDAYCRLTGYARSELIGHTTKELNFWAETDRQDVLQLWQSHSRVRDVELNLQTRSGEVRALLASLEPLDLNGEPCIISTVLDITERKRAEAAVRQWADSFEHCAHGIALGDPMTNRIVACNPAFARLHHCTVPDIVGSLILSVYAPDDRDHVRASIAEADRSGQVQYEARMLRRDGSTFPVQMDVVSVRDSAGRLLYRVATAQDITERLQADQTLRESEEKYRSLLESLDSVVAMLDDEGRFLYMNEVAARSLGGTPDQFIGQTMYDLFPEPVATRQLCDVQAVIRTNRAHVAQSESIVQGQSHWYRTSLQPVHDALGRATQVLLNSTDITPIMLAQRQLEDVNRTLEERVARRTLELAVANERLTELDRLKSKFVFDVTHELRTPVTSLSLYIDLLTHGKPDKREQYIAKLQEQMAHLHKLINDILDLSRLERDHEEANRSLVDLNAIAEHVSAMERGTAESAGLILTCEVSEALPPVMVRPEQLTRAITNLVSNAVKYTPAGGIQVRTFQQGQRVCLQVTDTGRGIPADELSHIFSRFYRGHEAAQSEIPGTGLGLAIVKEIVEAHGGTVEVESQMGVGSTFRVWLPVGVNDPL